MNTDIYFHRNNKKLILYIDLGLYSVTLNDRFFVLCFIIYIHIQKLRTDNVMIIYANTSRTSNYRVD